MRIPLLASAALALGLSSCLLPESREAPSGSGLRRVACAAPGPQTQASGVAGPDGSTVVTMKSATGVYQLEVMSGGAPPGTRFSLSALGRPDVGVQIRANGHEGFRFTRGIPARLTLSGAHCTDAEWNRIRNPVIVRLGSTLEPVSKPGQGQGRVLQADLDHLSGYAIAGN